MVMNRQKMGLGNYPMRQEQGNTGSMMGQAPNMSYGGIDSNNITMRGGVNMGGGLWNPDISGGIVGPGMPHPIGPIQGGNMAGRMKDPIYGPQESDWARRLQGKIQTFR